MVQGSESATYMFECVDDPPKCKKLFRERPVFRFEGSVGKFLIIDKFEKLQNSFSVMFLHIQLIWFDGEASTD